MKLKYYKIVGVVMHACMQIPQKKKHDFDYFSVYLPQFIVQVASKQEICALFFLTIHAKSQLHVGFGRRVVFVAISMISVLFLYTISRRRMKQFI